MPISRTAAASLKVVAFRLPWTASDTAVAAATKARVAYALTPLPRAGFDHTKDGASP